MAEPETGDSILIVDDTPTNLEVLVDYFMDKGYEVFVASDGEGALEQLGYIDPDLVLLDVMMPGMDGFETCKRLKADPKLKDVPVIFMTALTDTSDKLKGFQAGAVDYITKPFHYEEVSARVSTHIRLRRLQHELERANASLEERVRQRTVELETALADVERLKDQLEAENLYLREELKLDHNFEEIVGNSRPLKKALRKVEQVAPTDSTVLILGETGTGKELFARAIHSLSQRKNRPLVKVNCAALPANLIEGELFGHEKGAFTGALTRRIGRFELADGGTILLDELGELPLELQAKLLRVLQEGEFERLGDPRTRTVDVRVIAATNRNLAESVEKGKFRSDLYFRLNVFPIELPALRERPGDLPVLVEHFVRRLGPKLGRRVERIPSAVSERLAAYTWPGNVRELMHCVERALIVSTGKSLELGDWSPSLGLSAETTGLVSLEEAQRQHIIKALKLTAGRVSGPRGAAKLLAINAKTLESRMKKLGIVRKNFHTTD